MEPNAHPFFGGSNLDPPLSRLIDDAADLCEALARIDPEHELLDLFVDFGPDHAVTLEAFQIRFAPPGATAEERQTLAGQWHFWRAYVDALDAALRRNPIAAQDEYLALVNRISSY
jgi:hypothetical protein